MKVLVVSAHPDDETIGCGGTLLKHKKSGDELAWLITTEMGKSHYSEAIRKNRDAEIIEVAEQFAFSKVYRLGFETMSLDSKSITTMVPKIAAILKEYEPEVIYILNRSDAHSDHRVTFEATFACTKSFRAPYLKKLLMYECISETEFAPALPERAFIPNYFVDISDYMTLKLEILKIYSSELADHPFPRSSSNVKALNHIRGATAGVIYAEAFQILKFIDK